MNGAKQIVVTQYLSHKLQILSLVAIAFVVLQHSSYGVSTNCISGLLYRDMISLGVADFPVPYFFIVSGFFFMKRFSISFSWYKSELVKRSKSLLLPYLIFCTLGLIVYRDCACRGLLDNYGLTSLLPVVGPLWYVRTLFVLCVLSPLLIMAVNLIEHSKVLRTCVVIALPVMLAMRLPFQSSIVAPLIYFTFGIFLSRHGACLADVRSRNKIGYALLLAFILTSIKILHSIMNPEAEPILRKAIIPETLVVLWYGYDWAYGKFSWAKTIIEKMPSILIKSTFFIYCTETFLRTFANWAILTPLGLNKLMRLPVGALFMAFIVMLFAFVFAQILNRFCPKLYAILSGGRG